MSTDQLAASIRDVTVEYDMRRGNPVRAVDGVSLDVEKGKILGLVGESGCGKSSLARTIVGITKPTSGSVLVDGAEVTGIGWRRRPREETRTQLIFQDPYSSLNPRRTVGAQIGDSVPDRSRRKEVAQSLLERVGLSRDAMELLPHEFSGGQRQRIAIARALAAEPTLIIADEPVSALDASAQARVVNLLNSLVSEAGISLVFVSHDLSLVGLIADTIAVMYLGKIVEYGDAQTLWTNPAHPYTQALLASVPELRGAGATLPRAPEGEAPDPANIPTGCRFRSRCPLATDQCRAEPEMREFAQRQVACWNVAD